MAGISIHPNYLGVTNTNVRKILFDAARRGICNGGYDTSIWTELSQVLSGPYRVLYNSEGLLFRQHGLDKLLHAAPGFAPFASEATS